VNVADTTPPTITCPGDRQLQCGASTDPSNTGSATGSDNCPAAVTITHTDAATPAGCSGAGIDRTWKATDGCGNTATCVQHITFVDTTPPTITCPANRQLEGGASTEPSNTGSATGSDNCPAAVTITHTDASTPAGCSGVQGIDRTWKATDGCGNTATCVQHITFVDTTPPTITCPSDVTARGQCSGNNVVTYPAPTASDNCPAQVTVTCSPASGSAFPVGQTTVTCTAVDGCGNRAQCTFTVTVSSPACAKLTPTATTCSDFTGGTAGDLTRICYGVKAGQINNTAPGVFFYYTKVKAPAAGTFTVNIDQTVTASFSIPFFSVQQGQVTLYDASCNKIGQGTETSPGQASVTVSGAAANQVFVIGVKYSTSSVVGTSLPSGPRPTAHYDFQTRIGTQVVDSDADGLNLTNCVGSSLSAIGASGTEPSAGGSPASELDGLELYRPEPNPFDHSTRLAYAVGATGERVDIRVYDLAGRLVRTLISESQDQGVHVASWDGRRDDGTKVTNAIYFVRVAIGDRLRMIRVAYLQ